MNTAAVTVHEPTRIPAELEAKANESGLSTEGVASLKAGFAPHFVQFQALAQEAATVGKDQPKAARAVRLSLKAVRVAADKTRKDLKEDSLRRGKAIDGINALLEYQLVPVEKAMQAIEDAEEIAAKERLRVLAESRRAELAPFVDDASFYDLGGMPEGAYAQLLSGSKAGYLQRQREAAEAEAARIAAEKADAEAKAKREAEEAAERERMKAENERLAKLAAEERAAREKADAEARRVAALVKAESDRQAAELAAERARTAKLEQEARDRAAAEAKAEADRIATEAEARRVAAVAPDREKVKAMAAAIRSIAAPVLATNPALTAKIAEQLRKFQAWLDGEAAKL